MSGLSYEFPDKDEFALTLYHYLEAEIPNLADLFYQSECEFLATSNYTPHRWNEYWAELTVKVTLNNFRKLTKEEKASVLECANEIISPSIGYRFLNLYIIPVASNSINRASWDILPNNQKVFICYSRQDRILTKRIAKLLEIAGYQVWFDENIPTGSKWWEKIQKEIKSRNFFVYVMSPDSVKSSYCQDELALALENNKRIIPIMLRHVEIPSQVSDYQYADFKSEITPENTAKLIGGLQHFEDLIAPPEDDASDSELPDDDIPF